MDVSPIREQMSAVAHGIHKAEIVIAVINNILNVVDSVSKHAARIPKYKLPRIATAARRRRKESIGMMALSMYLGAARQQAIISQPILEASLFKSGGGAIVGGTGDELQIISK
jgi:hypothetical protein